MKFAHIGALLFFIILILSVSPAGAESNLGVYGLGLRLGLVFPESPLDNTVAFGIQIPLGTLARDLHLDLFGDFWTVGYDANFGFQQAEWDWTQFAAGGMLKYYIPVRAEAAVQPYGGAGLSLNLSRSSWSVSQPSGGFPAVEGDESEIDLGLHLAVGSEFPLTPSLNGMAELKYALDGADYFGLFVGVIFQFIELDRDQNGNGGAY